MHHLQSEAEDFCSGKLITAAAAIFYEALRIN